MIFSGLGGRVACVASLEHLNLLRGWAESNHFSVFFQIGDHAGCDDCSEESGRSECTGRNDHEEYAGCNGCDGLRDCLGFTDYVD